MAIIGYDTQPTGDAYSVDNTSQQLLYQNEVDATFSHVGAPNEEAFQCSFYCGTYVGDSAGVDLMLYDITDIDTTGAVAVPATLTNIPGPLTANSWNTAALSTPWVPTVGRRYAPAIAIKSATVITRWHDYLTAGVTTPMASLTLDTGASAFASTWIENSTSNLGVGFYFETRATGGGSPNPVVRFTALDRTNSDAPITTGTFDVVVYDGFGGTELFEASAVAPDGAGSVLVDDDLVGTVGDTVCIKARHSSGLTCSGTYTVIDDNA